MVMRRFAECHVNPASYHKFVPEYILELQDCSTQEERPCLYISCALASTPARCRRFTTAVRACVPRHGRNPVTRKIQVLPDRERDNADNKTDADEKTLLPEVSSWIQDLLVTHKSNPPSPRHNPRNRKAFRSPLKSNLTQYDAPKLRGIFEKHTIIFPPHGSASSLKRHQLHPPPQTPQDEEIKWWRMKSYLQFLTTPTADTPGTTLVLHFDNKRYLVGALAEGTQRAAVQQGVRLLKVQDVFVTGRTEWTNLGGLIGMILTLADAAASSSASSLEDLKKKAFAKIRREGSEDVVDEDTMMKQIEKEVKDKVRLNIFGAGNLNYLLATARRFVFRKGMPVDIHEIGADLAAADTPSATEDFPPTWTDDNIKVWAIPILPINHRPIMADQALVTGSVSPRKRSYDELNGMDMDRKDQQPLTVQEKAAMMAKSVVSEMFDSTWRLDALVESSINEVKLPAALFVRDDAGKLVKYAGPMPSGAQPVPNVKVLVRRPWPGALVETLPPTRPAQESLSYIIRNHRQRGRFMPNRAMELGVERGAKWSKLSNGESVENDKGETITPDMVLEEGKDGGGAVVVDLPSLDYVEPFLKRSEWDSEEVMLGVGAFVWMLGPGVAESTLLRQFMERMKHLQHVVSSSDFAANRLSYDGAAQATARLRQVDQRRYTIPVHNNVSNGSSGLGAVPDLFTTADRGQAIQLEPAIALQSKDVTPLLDFDEVHSRMSPNVLELAAKAEEEINMDKAALDSWANSLPQKGCEIITLGTGSAMPSKYRNVSATLLRVPGWGSLLFDCGENTLGQLKRVFNEDELQQVFRELRVIWISHMHADHHLGTVSVIRQWYRTVHGAKPTSDALPAETNFNPTELLQNQDRLAVISESAMLHWLYEYSGVDDYGFSRIAPLCISPAHFATNSPSKMNWFIPPSSTESSSESAREPWSDKIARAEVPADLLNLRDIQTVSVQHCHGARAVSVTFPSGFKASYSGDCRPSKAFAHIGKGSTVCIHEATFDDELQGDAEAKNHTTTSEALSIAMGMHAKACVLTHFSQRYQKVPVLEYSDEDNAISSESALAFGVKRQRRSSRNDDFDAPGPDIADTTAGLFVTQSNDGQPKQATIKLKAGSDMKVCVSFDMMRVKVDEIAQMEKFTPALISLFAEEEKEEVNEPKGNGKVKGPAQPAKKQKPGKSKRNN